MLAMHGHESTFLHSILSKKTKVGLLLERISIIRDIQALSNDSDAFASIKGFVGNLSLEWEGLHLRKVDIFHSY